MLYNQRKSEVVEFLKRNYSFIQMYGATKAYSLEDYFDEFFYMSDLVITLGGDGTTLKAVFNHANKHPEDKMPVFLSVNFGKKGFLSTCRPEAFNSCIRKFTEGNAFIFERILASCVINGAEKVYFLNECSILRHVDAQLITIDLAFGRYQGSLRADGIIIATETGSSAYAYSAGGPIISGVSDALSIVFLAPEEKLGAFVVGKKNQPVRVNIENSKTAINFDGAIYMREGPFYLEISSSDKTVRFIRE